ncbi:MAG TPA: PSD1 and planctomycete cytochrome C domain-containing protein [Polyangiaceae bacterium]|nr:PSD1 and planctomycete cytochrome C domain-containing protein [Polyangiaceae bacterium]
MSNGAQADGELRASQWLRLLPSVLLPGVLFAACSPSAGAGTNGAEPKIDFASQVQPILAEHCFSCHGADPARRSAGLRLDQASGAFAPRPTTGAPAIVRGDAGASLLVQRITAAPERRMPPAATGPGLTPDEIEILERWIDEGAAFPPHWSLTAPVRPEVPDGGRSRWARNPIDAFVLARLASAGLEPSPEEDPRRLIRRASLDLTGLPPSPEDVESFASNPTDAAYEAYVDRWLQTTAYGEHRARYWLDVARYADTHGYQYDNYRSIWPYRDYVVEAFARNRPFDEFTIEQLAGDLLPGAGVREKTATGFIRSAMSTNEGGIIEDEYRAIYAKDRVDTFAAAWLGLTVGCADCHDHKFDDIQQRDFYALTAFFRNLTQPVRDGNLAEAPPFVLVPPSMAPTLVAEELPSEPFAYVLERGNYDAPGELVSADVPASLPPLPEDAPRNRLGLAEWLVQPEHPLMARVVVNRFWAQVFGAGLVGTPGDLGVAGEPPSHPELLDWLAVEFRESGWDVSHMFRLMLTSATYRQSARADAARREADPEDRLLSRGPRFRMDGEMIRDLALSASGLLVKTPGGASVKPYQPPGLWEAVSTFDSTTYSYVQDTGLALYRRSLYTFWKRQAPPPALEIFNAPTREQPTVQRERTNTPLQALAALNDVQLVEAARVLATHALQGTASTAERLDFMALAVLARRLEPLEAGRLERALGEELAIYREAPDAARELIEVGDSEPAAELDPPELAAWTLIASTLLNLDEALTK